ncbi:MocR-like ectoine utilization transcription factor EhuR [Meridianimarinicoccus sp. RP-17]|uniref:MocR-like ectoine utilization transcription factor EhuR n=1 Tax=Meridianimarinicoccus zhengii TaxID=2056810 RepID=UPI001C9B183E|nr:PLP-dependent aminotransferase family protein [Phycocomes zhengii]
MSIWPPDPSTLERPAYHSLAMCLMRAIDADELRPGTRLPTQRALAFELGLSVQTVSRAYEQLTRLGIITGHVGRGSFVAARQTDASLPWQRPPGTDALIDCAMLTPVLGAPQAAAMSRTLRDMGGDIGEGVLFSFRPRETLRDHCAAVLPWLARCGLDLDGPERVLPTNGSTAAMTCALMTALKPGDLLVADAMGHHTLPSLASALGLKLEGLDGDAQGILPDAFARICRQTRVRAIYLMPAGLGPTATPMDGARRQAIVDIARAENVWIIENDAWGPLDPDRGPPIAGLAPERTFYFTGLTKCLLPGLRIGWLVTPDGMIHAARTRHLVSNWMATPLIADIATRWMTDGTAAALLDWQRAQLAQRKALAARLLANVAHRVSPAGMHVWLPLPDRWREDGFVTLARTNGVGVAAGANFAVPGTVHLRGVRICLGAGSEADIDTALRIVARLVDVAPEDALLAI